MSASPTGSEKKPAVYILLAILLVILVAAAAIDYFGIPGNNSNGQATTTTLSDGTVEYIYPTADASPSISAKSGQTFIIQLSSNAGSTGYDWNVTTSAGVEFLNYTVVSTSSLVGGPQLRNYFFHVTQVGAQTIVLKDIRRFSPYDVAFTIDVNVSVA